MKYFSVLSIGIFSLSIWTLFFAIFNHNSEPEFQVETSVVEEMDTSNEEADIEDDELIEDDEEEEIEDEQENVDSEPLEEESEITQVVEVEEIPESLEARASSRYNDILYDFEKDNPISVDDLLQVLALNE